MMCWISPQNPHMFIHSEPWQSILFQIFIKKYIYKVLRQFMVHRKDKHSLPMTQPEQKWRITYFDVRQKAGGELILSGEKVVEQFAALEVRLGQQFL